MDGGIGMICSRGPGGCELSFSTEPLAVCRDGGWGLAGSGVGGTLGSSDVTSSPAQPQDSLRSPSPRLSQLPLSPCLCRTARLSTALPALAPRPRMAPRGSPVPSHGPRPPTPRR